VNWIFYWVVLIDPKKTKEAELASCKD